MLPGSFSSSKQGLGNLVPFSFSMVPTSCSPLHACMLSHDSLRPHGLWPNRLLCPWESAGKNTGVCCHVLLQGLFPAQGSNPGLIGLLHWQVESLPLECPLTGSQRNAWEMRCWAGSQGPEDTHRSTETRAPHPDPERLLDQRRK